MNRIIKLLYSTSIAKSPKSTQRGFLYLQNGNTQADVGLKHLCRRNAMNIQYRNFSLASKRVLDQKSLEEDAERKIGWLLKLFFAGTATFIGYNLFPYMGENVMQQSVKLLQVKDPLFKRMGASRLARFAIDDKRRMKIVELGGVEELVKMLTGAKDDRTRKQALKALAAISQSDGAINALHKAGAIPAIEATPNSAEYEEVEEYRMKLLGRLRI